MTLTQLNIDEKARVANSTTTMTTPVCAGPSARVRFVRLNPRFDRDETLELLKVTIAVARP